MVLLTMTPSIVEGLKRLAEESARRSSPEETQLDKPLVEEPSSPEHLNPQVGNPISHGQITDLWKQLRGIGHEECSLEALLRGSTVYAPPPPPKPEPTDEYKALMARLRREEEERSYERMLKNPPARETFIQRFPNAHSFDNIHQPTSKADLGDDEVTLEETHRQITLLINFLVTIVGCAAAIWILARWWSTTARLFVTMGVTILVAIAEVAVYSAYIWRQAEGKKIEQRKKEVKRVVNTWIVGDQDDDVKPKLLGSTDLTTPASKLDEEIASLRRRIKGTI